MMWNTATLFGPGQAVPEGGLQEIQYLKGPKGKIGKIFSARLVAIGQGAMALN